MDGYKDRRKFAFMWSQDLSHDYLNRVGIIDEDFVEFLGNNEKYLEEAIVIIFSDHGHRYASIRDTVRFIA
jgi:membrane-anchored protein YejM (alkaline phosphatase superfamily)